MQRERKKNTDYRSFHQVPPTLHDRRCRALVTRVILLELSTVLQIPSRLLLSLDCFEQRLEVSFAETLAPLALNDLEKQCRAIFDRLGEDLEHVAFIVTVDENTEAPKLIDGFVDLADTALQQIIVR